MTSGNLERVVRALLLALREGLPQDDSVLHYMASTHGDASPEAMEAVLADRDSPDAATLAGLLLFPSPALMERLEPLLEAAACTPEEARTAAEAVEEASGRTAALLPDGSRLAIALEPGEARTFVERLRLENTPPSELARILQKRSPAPAGWSLQATLRHSSLAWSPQRVSFLAALLGNMDLSGPKAPEVLAWALAYLGSLPEDAPAAEPLGARQAELTARLRRSLDFHAALAKTSYEIMMAQGARVSLPHPDLIREELALLDAVSRAVTGRPGWALAGMAEQDLGLVEDGESLIEALGRLGD